MDTPDRFPSFSISDKMFVISCLLSSKCFPRRVYRIRPNYRTVRLGFSKFLGTLSCVKICIDLLRVHYKKRKKKTSEKGLFDGNNAIFPDFFFIKAYVVGTHLNCIDKSMQFK